MPADGDARHEADMLAGELERHGAVLTNVDIDGDPRGVDFTIRGRLHSARYGDRPYDAIDGFVEQLERMKGGRDAGTVARIDSEIRDLRKLQEFLNGGDGGDE